MSAKRVFIAIGGNSLIKSKDMQTVEDQHQAIRETEFRSQKSAPPPAQKAAGLIENETHEVS